MPIKPDMVNSEDIQFLLMLLQHTLTKVVKPNYGELAIAYGLSRADKANKFKAILVKSGLALIDGSVVDAGGEGDATAPVAKPKPGRKRKDSTTIAAPAKKTKRATKKPAKEEAEEDGEDGDDNDEVKSEVSD